MYDAFGLNTDSITIAIIDITRAKPNLTAGFCFFTIFAVSINFKNNYIMKKIILLLLLALVSISASARKSYITMTTDNFLVGNATSLNNNYINLSGEVPEDIENKGFVYNSEYHCWYVRSNFQMKYSTAEILNWLSEYGYEVEFTDNDKHFILSKEIPSGSQTQIEGDVNHDSEVNIADVNKVISLILDKIRENPNLLEELGIEQPK